MQRTWTENLRFRSELIWCIRQFFYDRNFCEVQTPILSADTNVDCYLEPLAVTDKLLPLNHHNSRKYYLQTSPEFAMKRLLAAGLDPIFQIAPVFRLGDRGQFHNVEFTMLEWYRIGDNYKTGMFLLAELIRFLYDVLEIESADEIGYCTYRDAFESEVGLNPHTTTAQELQGVCDARNIVYPESYGVTSLDDYLDRLFSELVQPTLESVIVYDFPQSQSQLAKVRQDEEYAVSERFELYLKGQEIANGYHEIRDASELRRRFQANRERRLADGRAWLPIESRLLTVMELGFPQCSGTALGIDRLLMVMLDADTIEDVLIFPIETA
ncbi:MAG: EF-P lysine aminoacylase EpmA [Planctomycetaceae bacterium]|nr:EF-P lysine aminoacylase EpmA [Planctomycetaceae bacterium]